MSPRQAQPQSLPVVLILFVLLIGFRVLGNVSVFSDLLEPIARASTWVRFAATETDDAKEDATVKSLEAENNKLRAELDLADRPVKKVIASDVIGKNVQSYRQTLTIDRGAEDGVSLDAAVLDKDGLVGVVINVSDSTAAVQLLTDPEFRAAGVVSGSKSQGVVRIEAGGFVLDTVNRTGDLSGKTVITSGLGGVFPPGLYIGAIGEELSDSSDIFARYSLERVTDYGDVSVVYVQKGDGASQ